MSANEKNSELGKMAAKGETVALMTDRLAFRLTDSNE